MLDWFKLNSCNSTNSANLIQNKKNTNVGISGNHFFPFILFVIDMCIIVTHNFGGKCYLIF